MENINETLRQLSNKGNFQKQYDAIRQEIMNDPHVRKFVREHEGAVTRSMIERSMGKLYEFITQSRGCEHCKSVAECKNILPGYEPKLFINKNTIDIEYVPCKLKRLEEEKKKAESLIRCLYMPKDYLGSSLTDVYVDTNNRFLAVDRAAQFVANYDGTNFQKGLYLYGNFGTGKTFILGAVAHQLAERGISSVIIYVPEFFREMKQSISDNSFNDKLDTIKKATVLMFDDIGAENMSSWARDEILGTILQYRMMEKLPTFFTSNYDLVGLEHHLTYSQRGEEEEVKAKRIIERIRFLAQPIIIDGPNRRK